MKKHAFALLLPILLLASSCNSDDEAMAINEGEVNHLGATIELPLAYLQNYEAWRADPTNNKLFVRLNTEGYPFNLTTECGEGAGDGISFLLNAPTTLDDISGNYTFEEDSDDEYNVYQSYMIYGESGDGMCNFDFGQAYLMAEGTLSLVLEGEVLDLTFNFVDLGGQPITGFYRGTVVLF